MSSLTIDVPESLLAEIDKVVALRKAKKAGPVFYTDEQRAECRRLCEAKGAAWGNAYYAQIAAEQRKTQRASRVGILGKMLQMAAPRLQELLPTKSLIDALADSYDPKKHHRATQERRAFDERKAWFEKYGQS